MEQNTQEWLDFRRNKIGSSDAAIIMKASPWSTTPHDLWEEKVYGKVRQQNRAMKNGSFYEEEAREMFEKISGIAVMPKVIVSTERNWQMASLDGVSFDGSCFIEIKVPGIESHEDAKKGIIAPHYNIQMQHQYSTDKNFSIGLYFSYDYKKKEGIIIEVKKDCDLIEEILKEEEKFYELMIKKDPPQLTEKDYILRKDAAWKVAAQELQEIRSCIKSFQEKEEKVKKRLIEMSKGQNSKGGGIRVTRSMCEGLVEYKKIPALLGMNLDAYRKPSYEKWTLSTFK